MDRIVKDLSGIKKLESIRKMFFNTPMLKIDLKFEEQDYSIYAKYEAFSFSGSIKDRMAYYIIYHAYKTGKLKPGYKIVEATSGNAGISLTAIGRYLGHPVTIVTGDWYSKERAQTLRLMGAEVIEVSRDVGFQGAMKLAEEIGTEENTYCTHQFANLQNATAHEETTAPEILIQLDQVGLVPQHFISGTGTGGTLMGCYNYFTRNNISCLYHVLEPKNAAYMAKGEFNPHLIQGIGGDFIPKILTVENFENFLEASDEDTVIATRKLANAGLSVGISSGANLLAAVQVAKKYPNDAVVTVFPDSALKYLSGPLCSEDIIETPELISSNLQITGYSVL